MKIPNKQELQQTALNHSLDIDFKDFMNFHIRDEKLQYNFNRDAAKISVISSGKIDKY